MPGKLSSEQKAEIIKRYIAGEGTTVLGRAFGVAQQSIQKMLKTYGESYGVVMRLSSVGDLITQQEKMEIERLYLSGLPLEATAKAVNRAPGAVGRILSRLGILLNRSQGKLRQIPLSIRDKVSELYNNGKTLKEVAELLNVTREEVYYELKRRNIKRRRPGARGRFHDNPKLRDSIASRYIDGESLSWLAEDLKCSLDPI